MKINVKKLENAKVGTTSTHKLDEEVVITDTITAPIQGQVVLAREDDRISANFDITVQVNINMDEEEAERHQIPLHFERDYLLTPQSGDNILTIDENTLDTNSAIVPEVKVNLPVQAFKDNIEN